MAATYLSLDIFTPTTAPVGNPISITAVLQDQAYQGVAGVPVTFLRDGAPIATVNTTQYGTAEAVVTENAAATHVYTAQAAGLTSIANHTPTLLGSVTVAWTGGQPGGQDNTGMIIAGLIGLVGVGAVAYALSQHQAGKP